MTVSYFSDSRKEKLAYRHTKAIDKGKSLPTVIFLSGFKSDMEGTKARYLEQQAISRGQAFIRFDYTGHGKSDGDFVDGTIGSWKNDARDILDHVATGDVVLVGSSMGGWIALLLLLERAERIDGIVGIAAAPDFTKDVETRMEQAERDIVKEKGRLEIPSDYDEPYIFTKDLLEDGQTQSILDKTHNTASLPLTLIQGKQDPDVPWKKALKIKECFRNLKTEIIFVEDGDHRLSRPQDLELIDKHIQKISGLR